MVGLFSLWGSGFLWLKEKDFWLEFFLGALQSNFIQMLSILQPEYIILIVPPFAHIICEQESKALALLQCKFLDTFFHEVKGSILGTHGAPLKAEHMPTAIEPGLSFSVKKILFLYNTSIFLRVVLFFVNVPCPPNVQPHVEPERTNLLIILTSCLDSETLNKILTPVLQISSMRHYSAILLCNKLRPN